MGMPVTKIPLSGRWRTVVVLCLLAPGAITFAQEPANVIVVRKPVPVEGNPQVYQSFRVPDWTTGSTDIVGGEIDVQRRISAAGHLEAASPVHLIGVVGTAADFAVLTNQVEAERSAYYLDPPQDAVDVFVRAFPPGGEYASTLEIKFNTELGATVFYRLGGVGAFQAYSPSAPVFISSDQTLEYYAQAGGTSPTYIETYTIHQRGDIDSDGDGIPDFVEIELGFHPLEGEGDIDGDDWNTFDELLRVSDPTNPSVVPTDSDDPGLPGSPGDGWADFDEIIRLTDPNDVTSAPVAPGVDVAEYTLSGESVPPGPPKPSLGWPQDGSRVDFFDLAGAHILAASIQAGSFEVRLAGDRPYIVRVIDANIVDTVLTAYVPSYVPCFDLASIYTPGMTSAAWFASYESLYSSLMFTERAGFVANVTSTAQVLALGRFLETISGATSSIVLGDPSHGLPVEALTLYANDYDYDEVFAHISSELGSMSGVVALVNAYLDWIQGIGADPSAPMHRLIAQGLFGETPMPEDLPPGVDAVDFAAAAAEIDLVLAAAPSLILSITGTIQFNPSGFVQIESEGTTYELLVSSFNYVIGSTVHVVGRRVAQCEHPGVVKVEVISFQMVDSGVVSNDTDSDDDGLADQWEYFWFGNLDQTGSGDPDGDGDDNSTEYAQFTNPRDFSGEPVTPTPTTLVSPTPTATETPIPTPCATPTVPILDTPTPSLTPISPIVIFDVFKDGIIDAKDLHLVISDMIYSPTAERSNFDGKGEVDEYDVFLFSQAWNHLTSEF